MTVENALWLPSSWRCCSGLPIVERQPDTVAIRFLAADNSGVRSGVSRLHDSYRLADDAQLATVLWMRQTPSGGSGSLSTIVAADRAFPAAAAELGRVFAHIRLLAQFISIAALFGLLGCGSRQQTFGVEDEKKRWVAEGWAYLEIFGRPAEDTVLVEHMSSATAREITAFARTDGVATNQVYAQTRSLYLVVSMQRPSGDAFALVFTKPKP